MTSPNLQAYSSAYQRAREYARANDSANCRICLGECLNLLPAFYNNCKSIQERVKCKAIFDQITHITHVLVNAGVSDEVKAFFNLGAQSTSSKTPSPSDKKPPSNVKPIAPVQVITDKEWSEVVFDNSIKGVATIHIPTGRGTGFIISDKGYLLTNNHVVASDYGYHSDISMNFEGSNRLYDLEFIDADPNLDVALCRFDPKTLPTFAVLPLIPDYGTLKKGAAVVLIGNPVSQGIAPFTGTVSYTCNNVGDLVFSAPSNPGCSGGPVLDKTGHVVGINKSLTVSVNGVKTQGFTNATPANQILKLLKKWKEKHNLSF